jgi:hypothetical protein
MKSIAASRHMQLESDSDMLQPNIKLKPYPRCLNLATIMAMSEKKMERGWRAHIRNETDGCGARAVEERKESNWIQL